MLSNIIERLTDELDRPAVYRESDQTIHLPADLVRDVVTSLVWAGDEIAQLSEDLSGAQGALVQMVDELKKAEVEILELQDEVASHEKAENVTDQWADYWASAV